MIEQSLHRTGMMILSVGQNSETLTRMLQPPDERGRRFTLRNLVSKAKEQKKTRKRKVDKMSCVCERSKEQGRFYCALSAFTSGQIHEP